MKKSIVVQIFLTIAVFCFISLSHAQSDDRKTSMQDVKKEVQDLISALSDYSVNQRDEAIKRTEQALEKLDSRINRLETRINKNWDQLSKEAREKARVNLQALREQRIELAERYGGWKNSTSKAWEHMRQGFSDAYQEMYEAWEEAASEYK